MKQNQVRELPRLETEKLENIFDVYKNEDGMYFYNLLQTVNFPKNLPPSLFTNYTIKYGDTWPFISYKTLNSPDLWWLICLANNIQNPIQKLVPGDNLRVPIPAVVKEVLNQTSKI